MTIFHVLLLSLIQGATEFLPVSSSAHLVLYNKFIIGVKSNLSLDIAMHLGSLIAVILLVAKPLKETPFNILEKFEKICFFNFFSYVSINIYGAVFGVCSSY